MEDAKILPPGRVTARRGGHLFREFVETILMTLLIFFAVRFSVQPFEVKGPSMQPGLHSNERVVVNLLTYDFGTPQRGDVVVFHPPTHPDEQYVKRIIGIPGDTIKVTATAVYVNGKKLSEAYIAPLAPGMLESVQVVPPLKLRKDQYWVMGDNRTNSSDSRSFGAISRESMIGKVEVVIWPLNSIEWLPTYSSVFAGLSHS